MDSPYFESASRQVDESKAALLKAVAEGGSAGKAAFDQAQAQAAQARQDAIARAAQRSALYGVGGDSQTFLGAYDARANQMGVNRANFESGLAQTQASGESYLEKARGAIPVLQGINLNKAADEETKIKLTIEAAKQKALADQEKEQRALQRTLGAEARAEARAIAREGRAAQRDAAKAAAKPPTAAKLLSAGEAAKKIGVGAAQGAADFATANMPKAGQRVLPGDVRMQDNLNYANEAVKVAGARDVVDLARQIGLAMGLDEVTVGSILNPAAENSYRAAVGKLAPPDPNAKTVAQLATATRIPEASIKNAMGDLRYKRNYDKVKQLLAQGMAWDAVDTALRTDMLPSLPTSYAILQAQFRPLFANAGLLKTEEE